ncbi:MAG: dihydroorotate dehydrogenase electron transfer subunit [Paramuribaculum sp.]|nr:dihydroorotate dehydrogenase electron transfer subunit [Paramuribaculum sp.]MDE7448966.1 dihydroorotate dehydrogenase electron transfer subunit [Paramuribaculum sp.]
MEKKYMMDLRVVRNVRVHSLYSLMVVTPASGEKLPAMKPGQFVEIQVRDSATTFLRRPISVNFVDEEANELWLLIRKAGEGTAHLIELPQGAEVNMLLPLGNGFTLNPAGKRVLLVGGGVGVAPLLYLGKVLGQRGIHPEFLLGARSAADVLEFDEFSALGTVHVSTEDGSMGEKGLVTVNSVWQEKFDLVYCCGPAPMMKAVAAICKASSTECEVSLENMMACGLGACLCCVEGTVKGNVCVCTEGPVFNINQLTW